MAAKRTQVRKKEVKINGWKIKHLSDAFLPRPPREYAIEGLFPFYSLNMVFGTEGSMKSLLLMDAGICISEGLPWLPYEDNNGYQFKTNKCNVLYIDCDNGSLTDDERINAFALSHGLASDEKSSFTYISMPENFDVSNPDIVLQLGIVLQVLNAKVLILDNLGLINSKDENSHDMAQVMSNLRRLADQGICVIVVHHQRKTNGDYKVRMGETLRGHSSIAASLDFSYFISRKDIKENNITIIPVKSRFAPPDVFGAKFLFQWIPGTKELETAIFTSYDVSDETGKAIALLPIILGDAEITKTQLTKELMDKNIPQRVARDIISKCINDGRLVQRKAQHNTLYLKWATSVEEEIFQSIQS